MGDKGRQQGAQGAQGTQGAQPVTEHQPLATPQTTSHGPRVIVKSCDDLVQQMKEATQGFLRSRDGADDYRTPGEDDWHALRICAVALEIFQHGLILKHKLFSSHEITPEVVYRSLWDVIKEAFPSTSAEILALKETLKCPEFYCKAWFRKKIATLGDLFAMIAESGSPPATVIKKHYRADAFLREIEHVMIVGGYCMALKPFHLRLSINDIVQAAEEASAPGKARPRVSSFSRQRAPSVKVIKETAPEDTTLGKDWSKVSVAASEVQTIQLSGSPLLKRKKKKKHKSSSRERADSASSHTSKSHRTHSKKKHGKHHSDADGDDNASEEGGMTKSDHAEEDAQKSTGIATREGATSTAKKPKSKLQKAKKLQHQDSILSFDDTMAELMQGTFVPPAHRTPSDATRSNERLTDTDDEDSDVAADANVSADAEEVFLEDSTSKLASSTEVRAHKTGKPPIAKEGITALQEQGVQVETGKPSPSVLQAKEGSTQEGIKDTNAEPSSVPEQKMAQQQPVNGGKAQAVPTVSTKDMQCKQNQVGTNIPTVKQQQQMQQPSASKQVHVNKEWLAAKSGGVTAAEDEWEIISSDAVTAHMFDPVLSPQKSGYTRAPRSKELQPYLFHYGARLGLVGQDFKCWGCAARLGPPGEGGSASGALFCWFTSKFYCSKCHTGKDKSAIPALLFYEWDSTQHEVSKPAKAFLDSIYANKSCLFAIETVSPLLIENSPTLQKFIKVRRDVFVSQTVLSKCTDEVTTRPQVQLEEQRPHLLHSATALTVQDLDEIKSGSLYKKMKTVHLTLQKHIATCTSCQHRALIESERLLDRCLSLTSSASSS